MPITWPLPEGEPAAIAVSGGADSFALLHWAVGQGHPVVALTVDHGLREGSAAEAQAVRTWCSERNVPHETLVWRGEKPNTGIQAAAREARYRLLCEACYRMGLEHLLTAHNADDQAETVFMRLRRGAGRGLAGMKPERKIAAGPGDLINLHRPLLGIRRAELRAYSQAAGLPFANDPSNEDERFERVQVRALLAALEQQDLLTMEALCRTAERVAEPLEHYEKFDRDLSWTSVRMDKDDAMLLEWHPSDTALNRAVFACGGSAIYRDIGSLEGKPLIETTIAGAMLAIRDDPFYDHLVFREPAALLGRADGTPGLAPVPAPPGSRHLYDRRFIVSVPEEAADGLLLRPLGQLMPRDIATSTLARQRISTLPCLADEGNQLRYLPEQAVEAVTKALAGWKQCDSFLSAMAGTFPAHSLLAERFAGDVIRY
nr:tRNA lysidine(34) synthetase TilS [Parvularcula maris]